PRHSSARCARAFRSGSRSGQVALARDAPWSRSSMLDAFYNARYPRWQRLEALLLAARGGRAARLSAVELDELGRLYRQATSDLAVARRDFPHDRLTRYLEGLVGR